jgi:anionic cell wall polymer biosynthesis LytR-Cps2A-Psr (LCP) family protein
MANRLASGKGSIILLALIFILALLGVALVVNALRQNPVENALSGDRVVKILFVIDDGADKPLGTYVFLYYPTTKRAAVFDIPGNIGVLVTATDRYDRIDTLYQRRNISAYEAALERLLGADIDFNICMSLENMGKAVDLMDGVELFIPESVAVYNLEDSSASYFFPSGLTLLDGSKAVSWFTYLLDDEEEESRSLRRQRFFTAFVSRLGFKKDALAKRVLLDALRGLLSTNIDADSLTRIFSDLSGSEASRMSVQTVQGNTRVVSGQTLIFPYYNGTQIQEIVRSAQGSITQTMEGALGDRIYTVEVLNGSGVSGVAGRTGELLRSFGYDVIIVGNADSHDYESTWIIDRSGQVNAAQTLGDIIRCSLIETEEPAQNLLSYEYQADFTLVIGKDFNGRYVN